MSKNLLGMHASTCPPSKFFYQCMLGALPISSLMGQWGTAGSSTAGSSARCFIPTVIQRIPSPGLTL